MIATRCGLKYGLLLVALLGPIFGAQAKDFSWSDFFPNGLVDASDQPVSPATLNGKKVLLYFASAHCGPCHEFCPKLIDFRNRYKQFIEVVFVSQDTSEQAQLQYMRQSNMPWPAVKWHDYQLEDGNEPRALISKYQGWGTPSVAVISKSGELESQEHSDWIPFQIKCLPEDLEETLRTQMNKIDAAYVKAEATAMRVNLSDADVKQRIEHDKQIRQKLIDGLETMNKESRAFTSLGPAPTWNDLLFDYYRFMRQAKVPASADAGAAHDAYYAER